MLNGRTGRNNALALLRERAQRNDRKQAIAAPGQQSSTLPDLLASVDELAGILQRFGAGQDARIAILSADALVTATAVLAASDISTAFPIDPRLMGPELAAFLHRIGANFVVCDAQTPKALAEIARDTGACVLRFDHAGDAPAGRLCLLDAEPARSRAPPSFDLRGSAIVLPTSGTTAAPKYVGWTTDMIVGGAGQIIHALSLSEQDRCLSVMPLFHGHGLMACLFAPLLSGGSVILPAGFDAGAFHDWLDEFTPTWWSAAPSIHRAVLSRGGGVSAPHGLRLVRSASAALPEPWRQQIEDAFGVPVIEALGLTEATHQVASNLIDARARKPGSVGQPTGVQAIIRAEDGRPAGAGEPGELFIRGPNVIDRYLGQGDDEAFDQGWLGTGDIVRCDDDGDLFIIGRAKELIKRSGDSVSPFEVESVLLSHPAIDQAVVFGQPHDELGETIAAAYVARRGYAPAPADIRSFAAQRLAAFKVPTSITACATLPFDTCGKVRRLDLARQTPASRDLAAENVPDTQLLKRVEAVWRHVLPSTESRQTATFFEMGGESLTALRLLACVRGEFRCDVSLPSFFANSTIAGLARLVAAATAAEDGGMAPLSSISVADPAETFQPFPLTELQQAYWVGRNSDFTLGGVACQSYSEYDLVDIDVTRLEAAWSRLLQRHQALRIRILDGDRQVVPEEAPRAELAIEDLRRLSPAERDVALERKRSRMSRQARAADDWPLHEVSVSLLDDVRSRLHVSFDGLILDSASRDQMMAEWSVLYRDPAAVLPDSALTVRDLVLDEKRRIAAREGQEAAAYWHARLADLPGPPELPAAPRGVADTQPHFRRASCQIEHEFWQEFRNRARRAGLTPTTAVLTAFAETVGTWSASDRFILNVPVTGRPADGGGDGVLGPLASSVLLEIDFSTSDTFLGRARKLQDQLQRDLQHRVFGSVRIARSLRSSRGSAPVFPVVFTAVPARAEDGLFASETYGVSQTPQVTLDLHVQERCDRLTVNWNWVPSAFVDGLGGMMFSAFCGLLRRLSTEEEIWHVIAEFRQPLAKVARLDDAEPDHAIGNDTLYEIVRRQAAVGPGAPALITQQQCWTFAELLEAARAYASVVEDTIAPEGRPVAIMLSRREQVPIAVLGVLKAGRSFVCIDPSLPAQRIELILRQADARLMLSDTAQHRSRIDIEGLQIRDVNQGPFREEGTSRVDCGTPEPEPDDVACIVFTSGTTGSPRGCPFTHRSVLLAVRALNQRIQVSSSDRAIAVTSFDHDMALFDLFGLWDVGGAAIIASQDERNDPKRLLALADALGATLWCSVPALLDVVLDRASDGRIGGLRHLRAAIIGGDRIDPSLPKRLWQEAGTARFISVGGPTETTIWSVIHEIARDEFQGGVIPYGRPLAGASYTILGQCLQEKPVWAIGEMACSGPGVISGYWRDQEETRKRFRTLPRTRERVFLTGDLGRIRSDGLLEILGRNDLQIKIDGERIELGEIDRALLCAPGIAAACSVAVRREGRPPRVVSFVVGSTATGPDPRGLRDLIAKQLPRTALPSDIITVEALPLTARGKLDHAALERRARGETVEEDADRASAIQDATIAQLSKIVHDVLAPASGQFDEQRNLVSIGATSVDVIRILNRIDRQFGVRPSVDDVFANMSVVGIAVLVDSALSEDYTRSPPASRPPDVDDPEERERFRKASAARRSSFFTSSPAIVSLAPIRHEAHARLQARRSVRFFAQQSMPYRDFSGLLGLLSVCEDGRRRYASSGGVYALDAFVFVKQARVTGLPGGTYFYDPNEHQLAAIALGSELDARAYDRLKNRPIFTNAAFAIYLVAEHSAITPLYGQYADDLLLLEAGYIGQLLQSAAHEFDTALCPIGSLDFDRIRSSFGLSEQRRLVHSFVGGALPMRSGEDRPQ